MELFDKLVGSKLVDIYRVCDLISLDFQTNYENVISVHIQTALFRVCKEDDILISSYDMYIPRKNFKKRRFKWDKAGNSLFDEQLEMFEKDFVNKTIVKIDFCGKDLRIYLDDNYKIDILANTLEEDNEIFRIFVRGDLDSHFVVET
ncbi:MAG: hypothetical protein IJZ73_06615 [Clostridia bacterium]|nr:hypothetical protein [Clostridia bacterium]